MTTPQKHGAFISGTGPPQKWGRPAGADHKTRTPVRQGSILPQIPELRHSREVPAPPGQAAGQDANEAILARLSFRQ